MKTCPSLKRTCRSCCPVRGRYLDLSEMVICTHSCRSLRYALITGSASSLPRRFVVVDGVEDVYLACWFLPFGIKSEELPTHCYFTCSTLMCLKGYTSLCSLLLWHSSREVVTCLFMHIPSRVSHRCVRSANACGKPCLL